MAYAPIALIMPQYEDYPNYWLKSYEQGTVTPLSMATDAAAGTTLAKSELDTQGFPTTAASARFIPFINGDYDLWLFPTEAEADANDTTNAIQMADNLNTEPVVYTDAFVFTGEIQSGYVVADKAEAVALSLTASDAGRKIFIISDDGGEFTIRYNATLSTYADDGGAYTGTEFIPTGGDGTIGFTRDYGNSILTKWFGIDSSGVSGAGVLVQSFLDLAETLDVRPEFEVGGIYNIDTTIYLGNLYIITNGCLFQTVTDGTFTQAGSGTNNIAGVFLTKSADAAGYGYSTVSIRFDELNFDLTRGADTANTPLLLENTDVFVGKSIISTVSKGSSGNGANPIDFWGGVQGVAVNYIETNVACASEVGGFWIRNINDARETKNVWIGNIVCNHNSVDEAIAIYTVSSGTFPDVNNIRIDNLEINNAGAGPSLKIYDWAAYSLDRMRSISLGNVDITVDSMAATVAFVFETQYCAPTIENLNIHVVDATILSTGNSFMARHINGSSQTEFPRINKGALRLSGGATGAAILYGSFGLFNWGQLDITTPDTATFDTVIFSVNRIESGVIDCKYDTRCIFNCVYCGAEVAGTIDGCEEFTGTLRIDTAYKSAASWFTYIPATNEPATGVRFNGNIVIESSTGTITALFSFNGTYTQEKTVDIFARIENVNDINIPALFNTSSFKLTQHDVVNIPSTGAVRITKALDV